MRKIFLRIYSLAAVATFFFILPVATQAQALPQFNCTCVDGTKSIVSDCASCCSGVGLNTSSCVPYTGGSEAVPCPSGSVCINNPISASSPQALIGQIINVVLGIVGSLALVMFIYGGIIWMTSSGSAEKVKLGRETLLWAVVGLVIIFSAYALVNFVIKGIAQ